MILTALVFLIILSILVLIHEFGHFIVGKLNGIKIEEFALGLPFTKPLLSKKVKGGMKISLYPILFGGFVKLLGEEQEEESKKSFSQKNVWQRISVVVAGVFMNFILAVAAFYLFLSLSGFKVLIAKISDYQFSSPHQAAVVITGVSENSPAKTAGLKTGEVILGFESLPDFQKFVRASAGKEIELKLSDLNLDGQKTVKVTPRINPPAGEGALGVGISEAVAIKYSTSQEKTWSGLTYTKDMFFYNLNVLGRLAGKSAQDKNLAPLAETVSGPVGIAGAVEQILQLGGKDTVLNLINLLGLLSLSLAFMNILPFPALDGGRLVFLLIEAASGKKLPQKIENIVNQAGMGILLLLIILISANDLVKIFWR
jgi:regulator of sigma E protease